jgi:hypothetical protein
MTYEMAATAYAIHSARCSRGVGGPWPETGVGRRAAGYLVIRLAIPPEVYAGQMTPLARGVPTGQARLE